jgi:hypothetical protein
MSILPAGTVIYRSEAGRALQSGKIGVVRDSSGLGSLTAWVAARLLFILMAAGLGVWSLIVAIGQSHEVNPPLAVANATVIRENVIDSDPDDKVISVDVQFADKAGTPVQATVQPYPYGFASVSPGQKIPIRYNENQPNQTVYNGPGGDDGGLFDAGQWKGPAYLGAVLWFSLALGLLLASVWRLVGMMRAALVPQTVLVHLHTAGGVVQADRADGMYALEWRVLPNQPKLTGLVGILGGATPGGWPVGRLDTGQLVWPRSKAHLVPTTAVLRLPEMGPGPLASVYLLLAGYVQLFGLLDALPFVIRRSPEGEASWWVIGALRPVVRALVTVHARRRLTALSITLLRSSLLSGDSDARSHRSLAKAAEECRTFAGSLPQRSLTAAVATIVATALSILSPFLLLPHAELTPWDVTRGLPLLLSLLVVFLGFLPLTMFFRSIQWKQALFNPPPLAPARADRPTAERKSAWDVHALERTAFAEVGLRAPGNGESPKTIRRLVTALYIVAAVTPFAAGLQISALPLGTLRGTLVFPVLGIWLMVFCGAKVFQWQRRVRTMHAVPDPEPAPPANPG